MYRMTEGTEVFPREVIAAGGSPGGGGGGGFSTPPGGELRVTVTSSPGETAGHLNVPSTDNNINDRALRRPLGWDHDDTPTCGCQLCQLAGRN